MVSLASKVTSSKYLLNKFNCFSGTALFKTIVVSVVGVVGLHLRRFCWLLVMVAKVKNRRHSVK